MARLLEPCPEARSIRRLFFLCHERGSEAVAAFTDLIDPFLLGTIGGMSGVMIQEGSVTLYWFSIVVISRSVSR